MSSANCWAYWTYVGFDEVLCPCSMDAPLGSVQVGRLGPDSEVR
ncbi:hypothetical protein Tco_1081135, partial [Tanacetum coccineum]